MKRRTKAVTILVVAVAAALPGLLLPLLPYQGTGCIIEQGGEILCGPSHASLSFYLFGSGFMSSLHGPETYYSWCTNLGSPLPQEGGYSCPHSFRVPW
jgi:hypothetical protein